jgi:hypothetical protein
MNTDEKDKCYYPNNSLDKTISFEELSRLQETLTGLDRQQGSHGPALRPGRAFFRTDLAGSAPAAWKLHSVFWRLQWIGKRLSRPAAKDGLEPLILVREAL